MISLGLRRSSDSNEEMARSNVVSAGLLLLPLLGGLAWTWRTRDLLPALLGAGLGWLISLSPRVARQWERAVVLRLGRYVGLRGPGLFWIVPVRRHASRPGSTSA